MVSKELHDVICNVGTLRKAIAVQLGEGFISTHQSSERQDVKFVFEWSVEVSQHSADDSHCVSDDPTREIDNLVDNGLGICRS